MIDTFAVSNAAMNAPEGTPDAGLAKIVCQMRGQNPYDTAMLPNGCFATAWRCVFAEVAVMVHLGTIYP